MRLHRRVTPGKQFHAHIRGSFEDFSLSRMHQARIITGSLEKRKNVDAVEACDAAERGDGRTHLSALESAQKADGDAGGFSDLCERETALGTQAAETLPRKECAFRRRVDHALTLEDMNDGGGVEASGPAEKHGALEQAHVGFAVEAVAAPGALRRDEAECLPR